MKEEVAQFGSGSVGIITVPEGEWQARPAFIFLNSGVLHRVGPNRLHVSMARDLAELGLLSFRVDLTGIGDSPAVGGNAAIADRWVSDTRQAMDYLSKRCGVERFVLLGNCSGAAIAGLTANADPRVAGAVLVNLQGPSTYLRYYLKLAFRSPAFWRRLFKGRARFGDVFKAIQGYITTLRSRGDQADSISPDVDVDAALSSMARHGTRLLLVYCSYDPGLEYFRAELKGKIHRTIPAELFSFEIIEAMNHDFQLLRGQLDLRRIVSDWAQQLQSLPGALCDESRA